MLRTLYRVLTDAAGLPLRYWLRLRAKRGKEIPARLGERRGRATRPRPDGRLVWFHAASVGEALSILPLVQAFCDKDWRVLVTTGTVTSAGLLATRLPDRAFHQFVPLDRAAWARRFLDHWQPDLVLWAESELWPNILTEIGRRTIPAVLINARLSDRAFARWQRWRGFAAAILAPFDIVLAQSQADGARFAALGAKDVRVLGNLKFAAEPLPVDGDALATLRATCANRPMWLAASIHPGEDEIVAHVHQQLKHRFPGLLTMVTPRHPDKGATMAATLAMPSLKVVRRSAGQAIDDSVDIYVADTMGELGLFFRLCDLVFMGKSLAVGGGQNPAEPALLGCALVLGPDMSNFREMTVELVEAGAAVQVNDSTDLARHIGRLLETPATRAEMVAAGRTVMARHSRAGTETLNALAPYHLSPEIR